MSFSKIAAAAGLIAFASRAAAHGTVQGIDVDGTYYTGYNPSFQYDAVAPVVIGWSIPEDQDNGFVAPSAYADADIICHKGATNAMTSATVAAGGVVTLEWTTWPSSHKGPVIDYLANCNGNCSSVDKTTLEFFKIDEGGLVDDTTIPGTWASDQLIANNNSWAVTIPSDIAPGNYVLRHEIIALHSAGSTDGAQNYPQCINLEVTGSGTATPAGVLGTALYGESDAGILINIYQSLASYDIPGPTLYNAGTSGSSATSAAASSAVATSAPAVTSAEATATAVPTSAPAETYATSTAAAVSSSVSGSPSSYSNTSAIAVPVSSEPATFATSAVTIPTALPSEASSAAATAASTKTPHHGHSGTHTVKAPTNTKVAVTNTATYAAPTSTSTAAPSSGTAELPAGTTFADLMAWLSEIVQKIADGNKSLLGRRHARDISLN